MKTNQQALIRGFVQKCREHKLKITPQRKEIYRQLLKSKDHPSVDVLYQRVIKMLPDISFDTVYRTLQTFVEFGIVNPIEGYGNVRRFDPYLENHHHLHCLKCNAIKDFTNASYDKLIIPPELKREFNVVNKKVILEGICKKCAKEDKNE